MKTVHTVCGRVETSTLGHCQMHEHLYVEAGPATERYPALLIDDAEKSAAELITYRQAGGRSVVDCQPGFGAGRNASVLRRLSEGSGVHIVAVTGYHLPHFYAPDSEILNSSENELFEKFLDELENGCVEDRSVFPGAVKAALGKEGCQGAAEGCFRAAARAAAAKNVPLIVHTEKGTGAVKAVGIARDAGLSVNRIVICHVDRQAADFVPHDEVAATGAMLDYDTIGRFKYHDDASEIELIRHMIQTGHTDQLLLSLDTTRQRLGTYGGEINLNYILERFLNDLSAAGVNVEVILRITVNNPQKVFLDQTEE